MNFYVNAFISLTIGIGAVAGWVRFKKTDPVFLPFLLLLTGGFVNEIISIVLLLYGYSNQLNYRIFQLAESLLICWQFYRFRLFQKYSRYLLMQAFFLCLWAIEQTLFIRQFSFGSYFLIFHSLLLVVLSIQQTSVIIFEDNTSFSKHPVFLLCLGFILSFSYAVFVEVFLLIGVTQSPRFNENVYTCYACLNLFVNFVFAYAVLCFPLRQHYIMRF